ncbi:MAG: serine/threonine-protein kinase [Planctomycetaceae bacterium]
MNAPVRAGDDDMPDRTRDARDASANRSSDPSDLRNGTAENAGDATAIVRPASQVSPVAEGSAELTVPCEPSVPASNGGLSGPVSTDTTIIAAPSNTDLEDYFETLIDEQTDEGKTPNRTPVVGDYQLVAEIGRGAMGVVYKARHRKLERPVALKMVLAGQHATPDALRRFVTEARAVAKFQHSGIVQIFEIGEHRGMPFMALELIDGTDLQKDLKGLPRDSRQSAELVEQLCVAMQYAHEHQVLHRDLKPANILLDRSGKAKISDFGLARTIEGEASGETTEGTIMGSPSYMPPEQAQGKLAAVSPKSDLYSLGAILYQMLTARAPFVGATPLETVQQVVHSDPVPPSLLQPGIPVDIETICMKALQKSPEARYSSCSEMAADLRRFVNGEPILARPVSRFEKTWRWCKRNPAVAIPSALTGLLTLAVLIVVSIAYLQVSAQAEVIIDERDKSRIQTQIARTERKAAQDSEAKAKEEKAEAERQKIIAEEAQRRADENAKLATRQAILSLETIQFFLSEVDKRLEAMPGTHQIRMSLLGVLEKKWEEIDQQMTGGIEGEAIPTLISIRSRIAQTWTSLDRIADADKQFQIIAEQAEPRLLVKDRNDASRFNVTQNYSNWSSIRSRVTGNPSDSEELRSKALNLLRDILKTPRPAPKSPLPFQVKVAINRVLSLSASAKIKMGLRAESRKDFEAIQVISSEVLAEMDAGAPWMKSVPETLHGTIRRAFLQDQDLARTGLASLDIREGKVEQGLAEMRAVIDRNKAVLDASGNDRIAVDNAAQHLRAFGQSLMRLGRSADAVAPLEEAMTLTERNWQADSQAAPFRKAYANSLYSLSQAKDLTGDASTALQLAERARLQRDDLVKLSPDVSNRTSLMLCTARSGNAAEAIKLADQLLEYSQKYPELAIDIARALTQASRHQDDASRPATLNRAMDSIDQAIKDGMKDPTLLSLEVDFQPLQSNDRFQAQLQSLAKETPQ